METRNLLHLIAEGPSSSPVLLKPPSSLSISRNRGRVGVFSSTIVTLIVITHQSVLIPGGGDTVSVTLQGCSSKGVYFVGVDDSI